MTIRGNKKRLRLDLLLQKGLQGVGVSRKLRDTLPQLLHCHGVLVQVESEKRLVVQVRTLGDVQGGGTGRVQLLGHGLGGVVELLQQGGLIAFISFLTSFRKSWIKGIKHTEIVR